MAIEEIFEVVPNSDILVLNFNMKMNELFPKHSDILNSKVTSCQHFLLQSLHINNFVVLVWIKSLQESKSPHVHSSIAKLQELGVVDKLITKWSDKGMKADCTTFTTEPMGMETVASVFVFLLMIVVLCLVILMVEIGFKKMSNDNLQSTDEEEIVFHQPNERQD